MFLITRLLRFSVKHPRLVITVAGAVTVCALVFIPRIRLRLDGRSLIPSSLPEFAAADQAASRFELRGDRFFNEKFAGTTALELMVDSTRDEWFSSVEGFSALGSLEWALARVPHVGAVDCLFNDVVRSKLHQCPENKSRFDVW